MNKWIICPRSKPDARLRLFCFPFAGGSATAYVPWEGLLPAYVELCIVELPGHGSRLREATIQHLPDLVEATAEGLSSALDKPFAFFGHSMGAVVAFELTRILRHRSGPTPVQLFVTAHRAPQLPNPDPTTHLLSDADMETKLKGLEGTPPEVLAEPDLLRLVLPIFRADFTAIDNYTYVPDAPLACPIAAYGGTIDRIVSRVQLEPWREQTTAKFVLQMFPGNHFFLFQAIQPLFLGTLNRVLETLE